MLKNYFITALRTLRGNKLFSLINVFGLAIGISASLVIYLIVNYDFSFDRFEKDGNRIYRVVSDISEQGNVGHTRGTQGPLPEAVKSGVSGLENIVTFRCNYFNNLSVPGSASSKTQIFKNRSDVIFADNHYFNLFPYQWLAGSPSTALRDVNKVVLTESRARIYFPGIPLPNIIGRRIDYADTIHTTVSGIVSDLVKTEHTDFDFSEFISLSTILENANMRNAFYWDDWGSTTSDQQLYLKLRPGVPVASVEAGLNKIFFKYQGQSEKDNHFTWKYRLQPLNDIHFNSDYGVYGRGVASRSTLYGLLIVAGILLLLACINFINLTTAQSSKRAREIGIRKTLGSSKQQLVVQFLNETFLITLLATILSLVMTPLLLKIFSGFIPEGLHFSLGSLLRQYDLLVFLIALVLGVSLLAGFYPALVLSSWRPIQVLKNQVKGETGRSRRVLIRQALIVSQFVIAQAFIMCTLFVSKQIRFMLDKDMGFRKEAVLSFSTPYTDTSISRRLVLLNQLRGMPGVTMTSIGSDVPSSGSTTSTSMSYKDGKNEINTAVELKYGDSNYLQLFQIPLVAGRNPIPSDTVKEILINEKYLKVLGFKRPEDVLGKILNWNDKNTPVVGVLKDFHTHSLGIDVQPMAFSFSAPDSRRIIITLPMRGEARAQWKSTISSIEKEYKNIYPNDDFSYNFLDESIASFYQTEQKISDLLKWATGLTIFISCLGLLGLVIYITNMRTKEIGVRKVLGASVMGIVSTLSKDFLKLVCLAFIVATPIAWWAVHDWQDKFAFRTSISWWVFALSGFALVAIAFITLSVQTIRAARANPVKSLRTE